MSRILLLLDHKENRRLLADALAQHYDLIVADSDSGLNEVFDLGIVDGRALDRLQQQVQARRQAEQPAILPFLLVTARHDVGMATRHLWTTVDELILSPIEKVELLARVAGLMKTRQLSLEFDRIVIQASPLAIIVTNQSSLVSQWNPAAERILGWSQEEVLGQPLPVAAEGADDELRALLNEALRGRQVTSGETRRRKKDGSLVDIAIVAAPLRDTRGMIASAIAVVDDITERKRAEQALAESERLRRSILESVTEGIHGLDLEGHIVFENPAALQMFGWTAHEMIGQHAHSLMHHHRQDGRVYPIEECPIYRTLRDGRVRHIDNELFFRQDRSSFPVEYTCAALTDASGAIAGAVVTFRDITDVRRLQEQLVQSQKIEALGQLAGGIAHDFNNNLSVILGFSDLALDRLCPDDPLHRYVENIRKAGEQSASLTRQLLAFSRKQLLQPRVLDLNALITEMKTMLQRMIGEGIDLYTSLTPELGHILADPGQVGQVLMNLAVNARDAMPHGGTLTIATGNLQLDDSTTAWPVPFVAGACVLLTVADTGCGMDTETKTHIFEPFFTTKEMGKGTGLGLSTVYGIIKQSGGYIWVDSEPGQGTTFRIYVPRVEAPLDVMQSVEVLMGSLRGSETILLVEDDEMVRAIARDTLQAQGYTVLEAMGAGGARLISERHPGTIDLLLTDVVMPYMSGPELAQELAVQRPAMKILYMSGYMDETLAPHGVLQPDMAFLAKPFTPDLLAQKVREVLDAPA